MYVYMYVAVNTSSRAKRSLLDEALRYAYALLALGGTVCSYGRPLLETGDIAVGPLQRNPG